ncbi:unnamed protein product [Adineta steineri]|uniref:NHL repeat containing protein n=1 Tax=Adineta steineri TaxID=433720 RepID=A0A819PGZ9_9BILA|nr:unnamed protein product [Adineta steineri]
MASSNNDIQLVEHSVLQTTFSVDANEHSNLQSQPVPSDRMNRLKWIATAPTSVKNYLFSLEFSTIVGIGLALLTVLGTVIGVPILYSFKSKEIATSSGITLRWNTKARTIIGISGEAGASADQVSKPLGLKFESPNTLYIADYQNNRVQKWQIDATNGTTVAGQADASIGNAANLFHYPAYFVLDPNDNIYVSDRYNFRVQLWAKGASSGQTIAGTGVAGIGTDQLNNPWGIALDYNASTIYIADCYNNRVMKYKLGEMNGTLVAGGNGQGTTNKQLFYPTGLYFDLSTNSVVIANWGGNNIVQWVLGDDHWTILAGDFNGVIGSTSTLLNGPYDMVFDYMKNLYVADTGNQRVQLFIKGQMNGTTIAGSTGTQGNTHSLLYNPYSLALDDQLNLYIADTFNNRIQRYSRY